VRGKQFPVTNQLTNWLTGWLTVRFGLYPPDLASKECATPLTAVDLDCPGPAPHRHA